jgi:hypothetical protein
MNGPLRLVASTSSQSASVTLSKSFGLLMPALLTRIVTEPSFASASCEEDASVARGARFVGSAQIDGAGAAVRPARWRYFESRRSKIVRDGAYLYDLAHDPAETRNLAGTGRPAEAQLRSALDDWRRDSVRTRPGTMSAEEAAALHALGYD